MKSKTEQHYNFIKKTLFGKLLFTLAFFFSVFVFSQTYYDQQWKKIEDNYRKGTYKSNLPILLDIQKQAMKDNNAVQIIKSLKAEFSIVNQTEDDTQNDAASRFFVKLKTTEDQLKDDDKLIYQVLLGEFFTEYYDSNSWEIDGRTNIDSRDFSKIETWSKLDFKNFLSTNYNELLKENAALKKVAMEKYKTIFTETKNLDYFPTLADWNSNNYIGFLKNTSFFTPNEQKQNREKINAVYSDLIASNSGNSKLYFQHQKINDNCEFTNCKNRFEQLEALVEDESVKGDYKVYIISEMMGLLNERKEFKTALIWADDAQKLYPKSPFLNNVKNIENGIRNPELFIHYEVQTQSNKPIHIVAEGKNLSQFSLNIYEVKDDSQFMSYVYDQYKTPFSSVKKSLVRKEQFEFNFPQDFKTYKTSLELQPLPSGLYLAEYVVAGKVQNTYYFIANTTKLIYKNQTRNAKNNILKLVNNEIGKPLPSENLEFTEYVRGKTSTKSSGKTSPDGAFQFPESKNSQYYRYYLVKSSENNYNLMQVYGRDDYSDPVASKTMYNAQIFIDRGIYRPGQIVYFKVINTKLENQKESVNQGLSQKISLFDANGEELISQNFKTNDFGSYNGSFTVPQGKLNGRFSLRINDGAVNEYKDFQVEEYKRPKFEVTFESIKEEYKFGETIEVKGRAGMFSGVPLSNSTVNYEIKKQDIRWRYFWWFPQTYGEENSILGTAVTNDKGEFTIKVDLQKDETLEGIQVNNYVVEASVTDINGETQSSTENFKVASVSHYISADTVGNTFADEEMKLNVSTKNYNDQALKKAFNVKLEKLVEPKRVFRLTFDQEIQTFPTLTKDVFEKKFPHDKFDKNDEQKNWKVEKTVIERVENPKTENSGNRNLESRILNLGSLNAGTYKLELFNIEGKDTIKAEQYFQVWDKRFLTDSQKPFLEVVSPKSKLKRGEKAKIYVYSAVPDAMVNVYIQNGKDDTYTEIKSLKNGLLVYEAEMPRDESISQLNVQFQLIAFNDVQAKMITLLIEEEKDNLKIETVTFRDKLQPGTKEKWTVKVSGNEKEKINAEVLANMYDKSLDQFASNSFNWQKIHNNPNFFASYKMVLNLSQLYYTNRSKYLQQSNVNVPSFNWFDGGIYGTRLQYSLNEMTVADAAVPAPARAAKMEAMAVGGSVEGALKSLPSVNSNAEMSAGKYTTDEYKEDKSEGFSNVKIRENLNETAFFYPNILTDADGNVNFEFTSPEALTAWKLMFLAHTKDARAAVLEKEVITQKEFSVTPNYPRFLREGDELQLQTKLSNLTNQKLNGFAQLQILDAFTNEDISSQFGITKLSAAAGYNIEQAFSLDANGNSVANWKLKVPNNVSSIILKVVAKAGNFSDGEQKAIAVLPNRMLVTDALPVFVKEGQSKTFVLEGLKNSKSTTLTNVSNTLELTTNPIWEILFALPSLKDDIQLSADVQFNKWFADVLASEVFKANPKMKTVFDEYQSKGLLISNLEKNQELKQLLLEETPWVLESKNEEEQMQKLARLFDANTMRNSIHQDWSDLVKLQNPDGGFSWYAGYPSSYYTSLYILKNLGKINEWLKDNVSDYQSSEQKALVSKLISYIDNEVNRYWRTDKDYIWNNFVIDYLDTRNYWEKEYPLKNKGATLKTQVIAKAKKADIKDFTFFGLHRAAMLFDNYGLKDVSKKLMNYLKETSTQSETQGVYWKQNLNDWGWYSSKTVNHAGALEAFQKLTPNDGNFIEEMKIWLVTQKEVNNWETSRSTAEVIFTILNSGKSWISNDSDKAEITWGGKVLQPQTQATGYVKQTVLSDKLDQNLATVTVKKDSPGIVQGGVFWQYYEDLDKIKSSESYISITKELYRKVKTENGEQLQKITEDTPLKVGDKVTVRMLLNTDRNMEFIHLKDMRAAGFEPLDVISSYQWKNNLGYYQSTKDASTNFYIENMPKGKYVFEYDYVCNAAGTFSNGITTLQNYYAPQMNAHTKGSKVTIAE